LIYLFVSLFVQSALKSQTSTFHKALLPKAMILGTDASAAIHRQNFILFAIWEQWSWPLNHTVLVANAALPVLAQMRKEGLSSAACLRNWRGAQMNHRQPTW
jgi:hypothetical protein